MYCIFPAHQKKKEYLITDLMRPNQRPEMLAALHRSRTEPCSQQCVWVCWSAERSRCLLGKLCAHWNLQELSVPTMAGPSIHSAIELSSKPHAAFPDLTPPPLCREDTMFALHPCLVITQQFLWLLLLLCAAPHLKCDTIWKMQVNISHTTCQCFPPSPSTVTQLQTL